MQALARSEAELEVKFNKHLLEENGIGNLNQSTTALPPISR